MKRYSKEERTAILEQLNGSGKSRAEFCREHGYCYATVGKWQKRIASDESGPESLALVKLETLPAAMSASLHLPGGAELCFGAEASPESLARFCREYVRC